MAVTPPTAQVPDILRFHREWIFDPIPPWVIDQLDKAAIRELGKIHMEMTKNILQAQLRAIEAATTIVQR
jgi:hypothetical protein